MFGKMSVGVRRADATPKIMIKSAMTMKVYGRRSASLTMPIIIASRQNLHQIRHRFARRSDPTVTYKKTASRSCMALRNTASRSENQRAAGARPAASFARQGCDPRQVELGATVFADVGLVRLVLGSV